MRYFSLSSLQIVVCIIGMTGAFSACTSPGTTGSEPILTTTRRPNLSTAFEYANTVFPKHISDNLLTVDNTPTDNPITNDGATLGRVLFYDNNLSKNNTISCGSCHKQELSFTDHEAKSKGFQGQLTKRHSMPLLSIRFYKSGKMFWDERAQTLEEQVLMPIQDEIEMGMTLTELEQRLSKLDYYPALFEKAFGSTAISRERIARALAQFVRSIVPYQSKYDRVQQGLESFTDQERRGEREFSDGRGASCASCHPPPMFITSSPRTLFGLGDPTGDRGINGQGHFKSPSLRNTAERLALFHNGSITDIDRMLSRNARPSEIQVPLHTVPADQKDDLIAFLRTLTDNAIKTDPKFSDPFK